MCSGAGSWSGLASDKSFIRALGFNALSFQIIVEIRLFHQFGVFVVFEKKGKIMSCNRNYNVVCKNDFNQRFKHIIFDSNFVLFIL